MPDLYPSEPLLKAFFLWVTRAAVTATLMSGTTLAALTPPSGAALYKTNCAACHGARAQGGIGPALSKAGNPRYAASWTHAQFSRSLLQAKDDNGVALKAPMPNFGKVGLAGDKGKPPTQAEITAIQTYLKAIK